MKMKRIRRLESAIDQITVKCPCGHSVEVYHDKRICNHCGKYVFKNKEDEFKYRLNEKIKKKNDYL